MQFVSVIVTIIFSFVTRVKNSNSELKYDNLKSMSRKPKKRDGKSIYKQAQQRAKDAYLNLIGNHSWKE
jgi:hypothetical protein